MGGDADLPKYTYKFLSSLLQVLIKILSILIDSPLGLLIFATLACPHTF